MSEPVEWALTLAALDVAIGGATGLNRAIGDDTRASLDGAGRAFDARWSAAVATQKTGHAAACLAAHDEAEHACRFVLGSQGAKPFDASSPSVILQRLGKASEGTPSAFLKATLARHRSNVTSAYTDSAGAFRLYTAPIVTTDRPPFVMPDLIARARELQKEKGSLSDDQLADIVRGTGTSASSLAFALQGPRTDRQPSVRELEAALSNQLAVAAEWLALTAAP